MKKTVIEIVNEKILEKLEKGINPWRKTWKRLPDGNYINRPINYYSGKPYNGINAVLLEPGQYLTFNQIKQLGGILKKGSEGQVVVYYKIDNKKNIDSETEDKQTFILRYYLVFNLQDTENCREIKGRKEQITLPEVATSKEIDAMVKEFCKNTRLEIISSGSDKAFYQPTFHKIRIPNVSQFESLPDYYATLFHEMAHSTGHKDLLDRGLETRKETDVYAKEELIAEITSAYMLNHLNIDNDDLLKNQVAYLKNWADHLKGNTSNRFIVNATKQAEKAFEFIIEKSKPAEEFKKRMIYRRKTPKNKKK